MTSEQAAEMILLLGVIMILLVPVSGIALGAVIHTIRKIWND